MRTLVHLSDLHFGALDETTLGPLRESIRGISPDLVAVSGDLTQRAQPEQFRAARRFLDGLESPILATPGNHDIPLWNPVSRFLRPRSRYRRHFDVDCEPAVVDDEMAVVGVDTTRSLTVEGGRFGRAQIDRVERVWRDVPEDRVRIVVTHHPVALAPFSEGRGLVRRASSALRLLSALGTDVLLAGHLHRSGAWMTPPLPGAEAARPMVGVAAGTATSSRRRKEQNGFNVVVVESSVLRVVRMKFDGKTFHPRDEGTTFALGC